MKNFAQGYFDYNATTPLLPEVKKTLLETLDLFGNPSSLYRQGQEAKECIEQSRDIISKTLSCQSSQLLFTGSATESNNHVLKSFFNRYIKTKKPLHILYSAIEHSSIRVCLDWMKDYGVESDEISVDSHGLIQMASLESQIKPHTQLIVVMLANNEVGTIQPLKEIVTLAKKHGLKVHTDAVQALGKIPVDVTQLDVDFLSFSGHKIYAPKGVAGLYVKDDDLLHSLLHGGGHERRLRAGTENILGIAALIPAFQALSAERYCAYVTPLRDHLLKRLQDIEGAIIHTPIQESLCNTLNVGFEGCDGVHLSMRLDLDGFSVSTGSACSSGSIEPSPVLSAMGIEDTLNRGSLRLSLGLYTTMADINHLIASLHAAIQQARA